MRIASCLDAQKEDWEQLLLVYYPPSKEIGTSANLAAACNRAIRLRAL